MRQRNIVYITETTETSSVICLFGVLESPGFQPVLKMLCKYIFTCTNAGQTFRASLGTLALLRVVVYSRILFSKLSLEILSLYCIEIDFYFDHFVMKNLMYDNRLLMCF